jgi:hypothetical protein
MSRCSLRSSVPIRARPRAGSSVPTRPCRIAWSRNCASRGFSTIAAGNELLPDFLADYNARFGKAMHARKFAFSHSLPRFREDIRSPEIVKFRNLPLLLTFLCYGHDLRADQSDRPRAIGATITRFSKPEHREQGRLGLRRKRRAPIAGARHHSLQIRHSDKPCGYIRAASGTNATDGTVNKPAFCTSFKVSRWYQTSDYHH